VDVPFSPGEQAVSSPRYRAPVKREENISLIFIPKVIDH
jgi:hypothetical protein